jgi:hypothetical protein
MLAPIVLFAQGPADAPTPDKPGDVIAAAASGWLQADARYLTVSSGAIDAWGSRTGTQSATFVAGAAKATVEANAVAGLTAARFGAAPAVRYQLAQAFATNAPFAMLAVLSASVDAAQQFIAGRITDGTNRAGLIVPAATNQAAFYYKGLTVPVPIVMDTPVAALIDFDGAQLRVVTASGTTTTATTADTSTNTFLIGGAASNSSPFKGLLSDLVLFPQSVLGNSPLMEAVRAYLANAYSLTLG